jgi:hypothetical protein
MGTAAARRGWLMTGCFCRAADDHTERVAVVAGWQRLAPPSTRSKRSAYGTLHAVLSLPWTPVMGARLDGQDAPFKPHS